MVIETHNRVQNEENKVFLLKIRTVAYVRFDMGFIFILLDGNNQKKGGVSHWPRNLHLFDPKFVNTMSVWLRIIYIKL